jgi:2-hydroxychromene-2-carboxylate isomerase
MTRKLEFFYDYVSAYSYLANRALRDFDGVEIAYRPMFLGAVMKATGNNPPGTVPAKAAYLAKDLARWSGRYEIPFRFNSVFPQNTLTALRLAVVAQHWGTFFELHQPLFDAMFVHDRDLSQPDVLRRILMDSGLSADDYLAAAEDDEVKATLKRNTEEAVARGAFGAPTFFVGDEMFFGNDRLDFVREALDKA